MVLLIIVGIFPQLVVTIMLAIESTRSAAKTMEWIFIALLPNYNMASGIGNLYTNYDYLELCFTKLPEDGFNMDPGKESLDEICETLQRFGGTFPCCKGIRRNCYLLVTSFCVAIK